MKEELSRSVTFQFTATFNKEELERIELFINQGNVDYLNERELHSILSEKIATGRGDIDIIAIN